MMLRVVGKALFVGWMGIWICQLCLVTCRGADGVTPAHFDLAAVRDPGTLQLTVLQDWSPVPGRPQIKYKLVEITVCEWWPGQPVRIPVTWCAPNTDQACTHLLLTNMGLAHKPAVPSGAILTLVQEHGVGAVLVGMGTIDAMEPTGKLHLGMKRELLATKNARYTPAWIWGMSDMRGLTAAFTETKVFQPRKVLATGGSKRGVGAIVAGIYDDRVTAILPVVAPIFGDPGNVYVRGSRLAGIEAMNREFLEMLPPGANPWQLPATARKTLEERETRRLDQSITLEEATAAGWSPAEVQQLNDEAWRVCRLEYHRERVRQSGLEFFYHVGTNDNVAPNLLALGEADPQFPIFILPGGQHGGPATSGFTKQTPSRPEAEDNLLAFARHHFFQEGSIPRPPQLDFTFDRQRSLLLVTVQGAGLADSAASVGNHQLAWCEDRHPPYSFAAEYDRWQSLPLSPDSAGRWQAAIPVSAGAQQVDLVSTHTLSPNRLPFHFSSPYRRWRR